MFSKFISKVTDSLDLKQIAGRWVSFFGVRSDCLFLEGDLNIEKDESEKCLIQKIEECADSMEDEVRSRHSAVELGNIYTSLSSEGKKKFLLILGRESKEYHREVEDAIDDYMDSEDKSLARVNLLNVLTSDSIRVIRKFSSLIDGVYFLIKMREDVLNMLKDSPELSSIERDLHYVLSMWFDVGLLELKEIDWDSSASLLERLIRYESVHKIVSWQDLKHRLGVNRKCYAFFHPKVRNEPLIFLEVALTNGIAKNVQELLDEDSKEDVEVNVDTAVFYSISNAQIGLNRISFGNFLIKRVVDEISREYPKIDKFVTLSPIPKFSFWLRKNIKENHFVEKFSSQIKNLESKDVDLLDSIDMFINGQLAEDIIPVFKEFVLKACAYYLINQKKGIRVFDPVAHFHISNGAALHDIVWGANSANKGMEQSMGIMVNYIYSLKDIGNNYNNYISDGKISFSREVKALL